MFSLLIDDIRDGMHYDLIARTYDSGLFALTHLPIHRGRVGFDHDLGDPDPRKTGYHLMMHMFSIGICPREIDIVSANVVGWQNMRAVLQEQNYISENGFNWRRI